MWGLSVAAAVLGAMTVPALGVYGPELFPTSLRGRANSSITITAVIGIATGLLLAACWPTGGARSGPGWRCWPSDRSSWRSW